MRTIDYIVCHCTATPQTTTVESIQRHWRAPKPRGNGWSSPGYHYIILPDGTVIKLLPIEKTANGVAGHNQNSIHISYIGGVDDKGRPVDNRTPAQKWAMLELIIELTEKFPHARVVGHRDFPGVTKACPSLSIKDWIRDLFIKMDRLTLNT